MLPNYHETFRSRACGGGGKCGGGKRTKGMNPIRHTNKGNANRIVIRTTKKRGW